MKEITVLTFGTITDITGKAGFVVKDVASTEALRKQLEASFPALKNMTYALAVNKQIVSGETALESGATVALLPPFSGG